MRGEEQLIINLIVLLVCGAIAAAIASNKGRSGVGWFFGGFFLGLIGIIIVACLSDLKAQRYREQAIERENRRLREQLLQEQMKSEAFRQHAATRLDAHDVHLGLDTRAVTPALAAPTGPLALGFDAPTAEGASPPPVPVDGAVSTAAPPARQWFYEVNGDSRGPIAEDQLIAMLQSYQLNADSLLWTEQLGEWRSARDIAHLRRWVTT